MYCTFTRQNFCIKSVPGLSECLISVAPEYVALTIDDEEHVRYLSKTAELH